MYNSIKYALPKLMNGAELYDKFYYFGGRSQCSRRRALAATQSAWGLKQQLLFLTFYI
jgi:hypothetical protein